MFNLAVKMTAHFAYPVSFLGLAIFSACVGIEYRVM